MSSVYLAHPFMFPESQSVEIHDDSEDPETIRMRAVGIAKACIYGWCTPTANPELAKLAGAEDYPFIGDNKVFVLRVTAYRNQAFRVRFPLHDLDSWTIEHLPCDHKWADLPHWPEWASFTRGKISSESLQTEDLR